MIDLVFETHATSVDNEAGLASGQLDVPLSESGERQAVELGARYRTEEFHTVFCSDLQRAYRTAEIAFNGRRFPIIRDARLREIDFGGMTRSAGQDIELTRTLYIEEAYPDGESYVQVTQRVSKWLDDLSQRYQAGKVMLIAHRAEFYSLEHLLGGRPLYDVISAPWKWQPGWIYKLHA